MSRITTLARSLRMAGLIALAATGAPALAEFTELITFPADGPLAVCPGFALKIESDGTGHRVNREPVSGRWSAIGTGTGSDLRLTNLANHATLTLQGNGAVVTTQRAAANGSTVTQLTGHNILFMFATDTPAGPSTTLYVGNVSFANDALGNSTLLSTSGRSVDLCAALAD